jgi:hypothetical protein
MRTQKTYVGIHKDCNAGLTDTGRIVIDGWVFGLIPEQETCEGWGYDELMQLYDQVTAAWEPFGHLVSNLPEELRQRHQRIYGQIVEQARKAGWDPSLDDEND